jgi:hypothetical protein
MALPTNALTTVALLETELALVPGSDTANLERLIGVASDAIEAWCGRSFFRTSTTDTVDGSGRARMLLPRTPLVAVTSVADADGTVVASADYRVANAGAGTVERLAGSWLEGQRFTVAYNGGYATPAQVALGTYTPRTLPYQLEAACILTCVALYRGRGRDSALASETLGDYAAVYRGANAAIGTGAGGIIPDAALPLLAPFRRVL